MKKKLYSVIIAMTLLVLGTIALGSPVKVTAATRWQYGMPKALFGNFQTKMVKRHLHHLNISKEAVFDEYRTYNVHNKHTNAKMAIALMWPVHSRKINSRLYQFRGITRFGKHVRYYVQTYSHHRLKLSTTLAFAHRPYYYKTSKF
ncbi:hypothetical protein GPK34_11325 [Secundilactobacillus kimchicus]|uniref:hypothetical protein n=1 Tax=Secundilactobacillus kimchicus TaxID=528209 RepID=UPI001C012860|nr:hypothetical protein [Secundilactobacillus kimchicus]MBT9672616.1 hypothetical protein [Secundilactobacillus kimchicus]